MRFFRYIVAAIVVGSVILPIGRLSAQENTKKTKVKTVLKSWRMPNDYGIADTLIVDTMPENLPMRDVLHDRSIAWAYNGNLISPTQSKIYFDRSGNGMLSSTGTGSERQWANGGLLPMGSVRQKSDFLFGRAYEPYLITAQDVAFHRTTVAYSDVAYKKSFTKYHNENDIHFSFTGNIKHNTNLSVLLNYLTSPGQYTNQEGKIFNGYVAGSYDGLHYGLHAAIAFNKLSNFENGGLKDVSHLGGALNAADIPVKMQGMSGLGNITGYLDHHYHITKLRDTVEVPLFTFNHTLEINNSTKRYREKSPQSYFAESLLNTQSTSDTAALLNIRNTLAVTFNEESNKWHLGATAYAVNEFQRYTYLVGETDTLTDNHWRNNTWVGGAVYKNNGRWVRFNANGDVCLAGYKIGEFQVNGHADFTIPTKKDSLIVRASAYVKNETPSWYVQHYRSNHYIWDNDFAKTYRFYAGGEVCYPNEWIKLRAKVGFENLTKPICFGKDGKPMQYEGNIQILAADLRADLTTPWVNIENSVVYQLSSSDYIPLPTLSLYHNLYYHGWWFKALYAQIGVDVRYHTSYYAPLLNPATGLFCAQDEVKIGNYPVMNLYANFYVKLLKLRFFAQWQHFNYLFMKDTQAYLHMPDYAMNPSVFRAGAAWHFWR